MKNIIKIYKRFGVDIINIDYDFGEELIKNLVTVYKGVFQDNEKQQSKFENSFVLYDKLTRLGRINKCSYPLAVAFHLKKEFPNKKNELIESLRILKNLYNGLEHNYREEIKKLENDIEDLIESFGNSEFSNNTIADAISIKNKQIDNIFRTIDSIPHEITLIESIIEELKTDNLITNGNELIHPTTTKFNSEESALIFYLLQKHEIITSRNRGLRYEDFAKGISILVNGGKDPTKFRKLETRIRNEDNPGSKLQKFTKLEKTNINDIIESFKSIINELTIIKQSQ